MKIHKTKSYVKLSLSSEIIIKLGKSKSYFRFVLILYLISGVFVVYSSIYLVLKLILILLIFILLRFDFVHQSPCSAIQEIQYCKKEWVLVTDNGSAQCYDEAHILIHNILFQLIKLSRSNKNKLLVLFNDQIPTTQLRLLHLKTTEK